MKKGKVGRTSSGFRSIEVHAEEGEEFTGIEADSGVETVTDSVVLSGPTVDIPPQDWPLENSRVRRIKLSDIEDWLRLVDGTGELIVGEGVVVGLSEENFICGPNGGMLWERDKAN